MNPSYSSILKRALLIPLSTLAIGVLCNYESRNLNQATTETIPLVTSEH